MLSRLKRLQGIPLAPDSSHFPRPGRRPESPRSALETPLLSREKRGGWVSLLPSWGRRAISQVLNPAPCLQMFIFAMVEPLSRRRRSPCSRGAVLESGIPVGEAAGVFNGWFGPSQQRSGGGGQFRCVKCCRFPVFWTAGAFPLPASPFAVREDRLSSEEATSSGNVPFSFPSFFLFCLPCLNVSLPGTERLNFLFDFN